MAEHAHLHGIVPPMTTPFRADDTIDEGALRAETRYLIEPARVHGLAVTGSTGEGHALTTAEVRGIAAGVCDEARGRVRVIAGRGRTWTGRSRCSAPPRATRGSSVTRARRPPSRPRSSPSTSSPTCTPRASRA